MVIIWNKSETLPPRTSDTTIGEDGVSHSPKKSLPSKLYTNVVLSPLIKPLSYAAFNNL